MKSSRKVLIIESDRLVLCAMIRILQEVGHEVLGIVLADNPAGGTGFSSTSDPAHVLRLGATFGPEVALLEHDFHLGAHISGAYFAQQLRLRPETVIGTSYTHEQPYCVRRLHGKIRLDQTDAKRTLIALVAA